MRRLVPSHRLPLVAGIALALAIAGCTQSGGGSGSADKFTGAEADVAKVVDDLQTDGERKNADGICTDILSQSLVKQLDAAGTSCVVEMDKAIKDADSFDLTVRDVAVTGNHATAKVQQGDDGPTATFEFVKESNRWKATDLGGG